MLSSQFCSTLGTVVTDLAIVIRAPRAARLPVVIASEDGQHAKRWREGDVHAWAVSDPEVPGPPPHDLSSYISLCLGIFL